MNCTLCTVRPGFVQSLLVRCAKTNDKEPGRLEYLREGWSPCPRCAVSPEIAETALPEQKPCMCLICVDKRREPK